MLEKNTTITAIQDTGHLQTFPPDLIERLWDTIQAARRTLENETEEQRLRNTGDVKITHEAVIDLFHDRIRELVNERINLEGRITELESALVSTKNQWAEAEHQRQEIQIALVECTAAAQQQRDDADKQLKLQQCELQDVQVRAEAILTELNSTVTARDNLALEQQALQAEVGRLGKELENTVEKMGKELRQVIAERDQALQEKGRMEERLARIQEHWERIVQG